jgi:hypothetical protein
MRKIIYLWLVLVSLVGILISSQVVGGETAVPLTSTPIYKWHPLIIDFVGPFADETDVAPNPFLDYRLQVTFTNWQGQSFVVPGFFAGDGQGQGSGNVWRVIFSPEAVGEWQYTASFRTSSEVAVSLEPGAGIPVSFDGTTGQFSVTTPACTDNSFLSWGRLEYVGEHYLKFRDGGYWLKGGSNSPENFLAYAGFDNTEDQGGLDIGFLHEYAPHIADWQPGDPNFMSADSGVGGKGIIGALNYLSTQGVNSLYFLPMNLGGDGQEVYPFVAPENTTYNKTHYDISKLHQWGIVFDHAQRRNIALHFVLAETEPANEHWLDNGGLGVERKLYFRELIARYGHLLAVQWNLSEENDFPVPLLHAFADYIQALDWANHPIAIHTYADNFGHYELLVGDGRFSSTSIQYSSHLAAGHVEEWRGQSTAAGNPWVINMDENTQALLPTNEPELRKRILYPVYFSGGNLEWYAGYSEDPPDGDLLMENFRTRHQMWNYTRHAREFLEENVPFWEMSPADELLLNEVDNTGQVFAKSGQFYAIYFQDASDGGRLDLSDTPGTFQKQWYDPRTGLFVGSPQVFSGNQLVELGQPPFSAAEDWVVLVKPAVASSAFSGNSDTYLPFVTRPCP